MEDEHEKKEHGRWERKMLLREKKKNNAVGRGRKRMRRHALGEEENCVNSFQVSAI